MGQRGLAIQPPRAAVGLAQTATWPEPDGVRVVFALQYGGPVLLCSLSYGVHGRPV